MSPPIVDYFFSLQSTWSYIGHAAFMAVIQRHGVAVRWRPMSLGTVFPQSGGLVLAQRHPSRQRYRKIEMMRWSALRGLPMRIEPAHWPFDPGLADRLVIALVLQGVDPSAFLARAFSAIWEQDRDLADAAVLAELVSEAGTASGTDPQPEALLDLARSQALVEAYAANSGEALDLGIFGAPTYVRDGELFWGQDRIDMLDAALASGRAPIRLRA